MATTLQFYGAIAECAAHEITERHVNWMRFLDTAARLYKYSFPDQLMIYAQKPDASAVAQVELWNEKFKRWPRRDSKAIALIDDSSNYPQFKYVFDVADTEPLIRNSPPVYLWEMRQEHKDAVLSELAKSYDDVYNSYADTFLFLVK